MATFTTKTQQAARKDHRCSICLRWIGAGESYWRQRGFDGGDAWTFRWCAHCDAVTRLYDPRDVDDLVSCDAFESWIEDRPRDIAEARAMVGFRVNWRAKSGRLLPIPGGAS